MLHKINLQGIFSFTFDYIILNADCQQSYVGFLTFYVKQTAFDFIEQSGSIFLIIRRKSIDIFKKIWLNSSVVHLKV